MDKEQEILPDGIIEQRIQRMAADIEPAAWEYCNTHPKEWKDAIYMYYHERCHHSKTIATKLVAAGWCPGPIGEKPVLDKYFKAPE